MPTTFDPTKPCRTRNGHTVRILCTDAHGFFPIVALVYVPGVGEQLFRFTLEGARAGAGAGACPGVSPDSLENVPKRHEVIVPLAMDEFGKPEFFRPERFPGRPRIGHIRVTVEGARIVGAEILP
jgi:hypothetical protein